jgi:uncharacterized protein YegL
LLDSSGSMEGEAISSLNSGMHALASAVRQDDGAREAVRLCVITFDEQARVLLPPTHVSSWPSPPEIQARPATPSFLGLALGELLKQVDLQRGTLQPVVLVLTDGKVSDVGRFRQAAEELRLRQLATVMVCLAGPVPSPVHVAELTESIVSIGTVDAFTFSALLRAALHSAGPADAGDAMLASPPAEILLKA